MSRMFGMGALLLALFSLVSVAPYLTSASNYGSPFYPRYSGNEALYPTVNITGDFLERNEDAQRMGRIGAFVNAYVTSWGARRYYALKTGKRDFCPDSRVWSQLFCESSRSTGAPTSVKFRFFYVLSLLVLAVFARGWGRFLIVCLIVGPFAMPTEMIGYLRYTPWVIPGCALALTIVVDEIFTVRARRFWTMAGFALFAFAVGIELVIFSAAKIDRAYAIRMSLKSPSFPPVILATKSPCLTTFCSNAFNGYGGNLSLLRRVVPVLASAEMVVDPRGRISDFDKWQGYFDDSFLVPPDFDRGRFSMFLANANIADRRKRLVSYPIIVAKTFFITVPKLIMEVIRG